MWKIEERDSNGNWNPPRRGNKEYRNASEAEGAILYLSAKEGVPFTNYRIIPVPVEDRISETVCRWSDRVTELDESMRKLIAFLHGSIEMNEDQLEDLLYQHVENTRDLTSLAVQARVAILARARQAAATPEQVEAYRKVVGNLEDAD